MPALVRDLVLFLAQLPAEGEANNPNHDTFGGEYRKTGHGQDCPTGNQVIRTRIVFIDSVFIGSVAIPSVLLTCQLPS